MSMPTLRAIYTHSKGVTMVTINARDNSECCNNDPEAIDILRGIIVDS